MSTNKLYVSWASAAFCEIKAVVSRALDRVRKDPAKGPFITPAKPADVHSLRVLVERARALSRAGRNEVAHEIQGSLQPAPLRSGDLNAWNVQRLWVTRETFEGLRDRLK